MDNETLITIARQLRKPEGEPGIQVGIKMNEGNLYINKYSIEALDVQKDDNILEIGMGNGFFVEDIVSADQTVKYAGCDFSPLMIEEALKINQSLVDEGRAEFHLCRHGTEIFTSARKKSASGRTSFLGEYADRLHNRPNRCLFTI